MDKVAIDYGKLVDQAMHIIVRNVLKLVQKDGLPDEHHFFISFVTKFPGVSISKNLNEKYPKEMTIVIQYQYQDLVVDDEGFSITLSFNGYKESIRIPYAAITTFADPSVQFGLQFREVPYDFNENHLEQIEQEIPKNDAKKPTLKKTDLSKKSLKSKKEKKTDNVVLLEQYRKK